MNLLQSAQTLGSLSTLASSVARRRPVSEIIGNVAGAVYASQASAVGGLGSGLVAGAVGSVAEGVGDVAQGVASGVIGALQSASRLGGAASAYVTGGVRALGNLVDVHV